MLQFAIIGAGGHRPQLDKRYQRGPLFVLNEVRMVSFGLYGLTTTTKEDRSLPSKRRSVPLAGRRPFYADEDFDLADPETTGQIMAFNVGRAVAPDPTTPPQFLVLAAIAPLPTPVTTRPLALMEMMSEFWDGPAEAMLGNVDDAGIPEHKMWADPVSEAPNVGDTETWEFFNFTADAHPMHIHEIAFEVVNREALMLEGEETAVPAQLTGEVRPPEAWESGFKDTVIAYPGEVTRVSAKFDNAGQYV